MSVTRGGLAGPWADYRSNSLRHSLHERHGRLECLRLQQGADAASLVQLTARKGVCEDVVLSRNVDNAQIDFMSHQLVDGKFKDLVVDVVHTKGVEEINGVHAVCLDDKAAWRRGSTTSPVDCARDGKAS